MGDFYSRSMFRDLLFHEMEHNFDLMEIRSFLKRIGLEFLGLNTKRMIHDKFKEQSDYYMLKYYRGIDQFIYENISYNLYTKEDNFCSYQTVLDEEDYCVYLFNQRGEEMLKDGWYGKYFKSHI